MATIIKCNGEITQVSPKNGKYFELHELQEHVGGWIEGIHLPDNSMMYVNEDGLELEIPDNKAASKYLYDKTGCAEYCIVGPAIVVPFSEESDACDEEDDD